MPTVRACRARGPWLALARWTAATALDATNCGDWGISMAVQSQGFWASSYAHPHLNDSLAKAGIHSCSQGRSLTPGTSPMAHTSCPSPNHRVVRLNGSYCQAASRGP